MKGKSKTMHVALTVSCLAIFFSQSVAAFETACFQNSNAFRRTPPTIYPISTHWARSRWTEADLVVTAPNAITHLSTANGPGCPMYGCIGTPATYPITGELIELGELQTILIASQTGPYSLFVVAFLSYLDPNAGYVQFGAQNECFVPLSVIRPRPGASGGPRM